MSQNSGEQKFATVELVQHLLNRHMDLLNHTVWLGVSVCAFPCYNLSEQLVGYQRYNPLGDKKLFNHPSEGKYYTYRTKPELAVWGMESWKYSETLFVTEGIFDACRLTKFGMSAVATLSNDCSDSLKNWFWTVRKFRKVVAICDNDKAGRKLAKIGTTFEIVEDFHDLGDASDEYVLKLIEKHR